MSRYIDADLLRAEIEKRMHICDGIFERDSNTYYQGKAVAYQETLSFIDSLQQKQPEVKLNEEIIINEFHAIRDKCFNEGIEGFQREKLIARHFYELGLKAKKEE